MTQKRFAVLMAIFLILTACNKPAETVSEPLTGLKMLEGGKIFAVPTGTAADQMVLKRFPDASLQYYSTVLDCALAVKIGKADAAVYDLPVLKNIAGKNGGMQVIEELIVPDNYGFAVTKDNPALKKAIDETYQEIKSNGIYEEMMKRWFPDQGNPGPAISIENPGTSGTLIYGTAAVTEPMSYVTGPGEIIGFDIEFAERIAARLNKKLEIVNMEFGAMLPALISGKVEMIGAGLSITEERAKTVLFSEPYYISGIVALVRANLSSSTEKNSTPASQNTPKAKSYKRLGVLMGSIHESYALKTYPETEILSYNSTSDMLLALENEKIEAAFLDHTSVKEVLAANPRFVLLEKDLFTVDIAAGISKKNPELLANYNAFLENLKSTGVYDDMVKRWMTDDNREMPAIKMTESSSSIKIGIVSDTGFPFATKVEDEWNGFEVELGIRYSNWCGKKVEWVDMPFGSLLPSLVSGKIDVIMASLMVTDERKKQIDFSSPYYASGISIIGKKSDPGLKQDITSKSKPDGSQWRSIGVLMGSMQEKYAMKNYPDIPIQAYNTVPDILLAINLNKVDAAFTDYYAMKKAVATYPDIVVIEEQLFKVDIGVGFDKKSTGLRDAYNAFLKEIKQTGTYDSLVTRWMLAEDENYRAIRLPAGKNGILKVGTSTDIGLPFTAKIDGQFQGFDAEMSARFAESLGKSIEWVDMPFGSLLPSLVSGKIDMIASTLAITDERKLQIDFSDPYHYGAVSVLGRKSGSGPAVSSSSFITQIKESFYNNIIKEKRYKLILNGLWITILISILAAIFGTLLGALICSMRMSKKNSLRAIAKAYISLVRGTPVLVLLMIIYYVIFASLNIDAVLVAVIAFGINFAAYVSEMFRTGIESIDKGQKEAGIASGFSSYQTFIHIILPQALRQVLPVYKGEFVSLLKMTSIVGYIAVEDLTKASDIIRSRTFDAFFPLIMAAVIYIFIAWMLTLILDYIEISVDPHKRIIRLKKGGAQ